MTSYTVAVLSAGLGRPSSTRLLADRLAGAVSTATAAASEGVDDIRVVDVELREYAHDIMNNMLTGFAGPALQAGIDTVTGADALIAVTPIFNSSFSGLFKSFFDVIDRDAIVDKPTIIAATGGSARHSLALEFAVRPLLAYLRARTVGTAVFAATGDFGSDESGASLTSRIARSAAELVAVLRSQPSTPRTDPFDLPVSFEDLLNR